MRLVIFSAVPRWYSFRGDRLLNRLQSDGHDVAAIVVQPIRSSTLIRELRMRFNKRAIFRKVAGRTVRLLRGRSQPEHRGANALPPVFYVKDHNTPECVRLVRSLSPDLVVLRGSGIVKKEILSIPRLGTINAHWGLLPTYRGVDVTEWAALHGDPVGVTIHFVDPDVDTGPILRMEAIPMQPTDTTGDLREKSAACSVQLVAEVVRGIERGSVVPVPQDLCAGRQYFRMHPRLHELANRRLRRMDAAR